MRTRDLRRYLVIEAGKPVAEQMRGGQTSRNFRVERDNRICFSARRRADCGGSPLLQPDARRRWTALTWNSSRLTRPRRVTWIRRRTWKPCLVDSGCSRRLLTLLPS